MKKKRIHYSWLWYAVIAGIAVVLVLLWRRTTSANYTGPHDFIDARGRYRTAAKAMPWNNSSWTVIASSPAGTAGYVTSVWFAWLTSDTTTNVMNGRFRMTFNQAASPQFGGVNGINVEGLFGPGWNEFSATPTKTRHHGGWKLQPTAGGQYVYGYIDHWRIPFTNGFTVEFYSGVTANLSVYYQIDWSPGTVVGPQQWVMYADQSPAPLDFTLSPQYPPLYTTNNVALATLLDTSSSAVLFLIRHWMESAYVSNQGTSPAQFLEGAYTIYTDGQLTFKTSGTEDMYNSAYYFADAASNAWQANEDDYGYPSLAAPDLLGNTCLNACRTSVYRYFAPDELPPQSIQSMRVQWQNGDPAYNSGYPTRNAHFVFWYQQLT